MILAFDWGSYAMRWLLDSCLFLEMCIVAFVFRLNYTELCLVVWLFLFLVMAAVFHLLLHPFLFCVVGMESLEWCGGVVVEHLIFKILL